LLPTPRTSDARGPALHGDGGPDLCTTISYLPTPLASDGVKGSPAQRGSKGDPTLASTAVATAAAWGPYAAAVARWEALLGRPAPAPTIPGRHGRPVLSPSFVEWLMGLPYGWVCGIGPPRTVALRVLGNGVVPQQAATALRVLLARHLGAGAAE
jgi:DNA (cytosine-5)-methyltransferase 1